MLKIKPLMRSIGLVLIIGMLLTGLMGCAVFYINWNPGTTTSSSGDSTTGSTTNPLDERYVWTGKILSIESDRAFLASVDTAYQAMLGDKAHVGLYDYAKVVLNNTGEAISLLSVPVGSQVIVTITGGIRESYPVQVSAVEVRVMMD